MTLDFSYDYVSMAHFYAENVSHFEFFPPWMDLLGVNDTYPAPDIPQSINKTSDAIYEKYGGHYGVSSLLDIDYFFY